MGDQLTKIRAVVRALDGDDAIVEAERGGCGRCHEKGGCGGQHLTQMLCAGPKTYRVRNPEKLGVGENVTVAIAAGVVRRSANLAYGLPIVGVIGGAMVGLQLAGDPGAIMGSTAGLLGSWLFARWKTLAGTGKSDIRPYIVSRVHIPS